jgi:hypothetical protein
MSEAALQPLFERGRLWRGQGNALPRSALPTGFATLDAVLPGGGWPVAALSEILLPADGVGEWHTLWPLLARLSAQGGRIVLVAPPYVPFAPAWAAAGIALPQLQIVQTDDDRNAMWVAEQCLRSAACAAVVCWPRQGDPRTLRRLQLAAESGQCQGFAMRPAGAAAQPSMAALRILLEVDPPQWRVLKCRGGNPPGRAVSMFERDTSWQKPSPSIPLPSEGGRSAAPRMLSPPSTGRAAEQAERAALARSAGGMHSGADIADQKSLPSMALRARSLTRVAPGARPSGRPTPFTADPVGRSRSALRAEGEDKAAS